MDTNKRIDEIDVIKALAIIGMVWHHIGLPFTKFITLFHMAVFFICSGIVYKAKYSECVSSFIVFTKNKLRTLWFPYACCAIVFILLNNTFLEIGFYSLDDRFYFDAKRIMIDCLRGVLFVKQTPVSAATWFLNALFFVSEFYCLFELILRKLHFQKIPIIQFVISVILLVFLYFIRNRLISHKTIYIYIAHFVLGYNTYCLGVLFNQYKIITISKNKSLIFKGLVFICSVVFLTLSTYIGNISMAEGEFENPIFFLIMSILGFSFLLCISFFICSLPVIKSTVLVIGKNTMAIMLLHLLIFKFLNVIFVNIYNLDKNLIAAYPSLYDKVDNHKIIIGCCYLCIGVILPVVINILKRKVIQKFIIVRKKHED